MQVDACRDHGVQCMRRPTCTRKAPLEQVVVCSFPRQAVLYQRTVRDVVINILLEHLFRELDAVRPQCRWGWWWQRWHWCRERFVVLLVQSVTGICSPSSAIRGWGSGLSRAHSRGGRRRGGSACRLVRPRPGETTSGSLVVLKPGPLRHRGEATLYPTAAQGAVASP